MSYQRKRVVSFVLAMSIFASSVSTLSAAAEGADQTPQESSLNIELVSLAEGDSTAAAAEGDASSEAEADSSSDAGNDGEDGDADSEADSSSELTIERPQQSGTVETLPGDKDDNKEQIKEESKEYYADQQEKQDKGEADADSDSDSDTETDAGSDVTGDSSASTETTPESGSSSTTEETDKETEEDTTNYSVAYDNETGHFQITYNIAPDAEGDQTIDLSQVQAVVNKYGAQAVKEYLDTLETKCNDKTATEAEKAAWSDYENYVYYNSTFNCKLPSGLTYSYNPKTGAATLIEEPNCTTTFDVTLSSGSKHTYVYKNNSLNVATPDLTGKGNSGVTGFDGQELTTDQSTANYNWYVSRDPEKNGALEQLVDKALQTYSGVTAFVDSDGNFVNRKNVTVEKGTELVQIGAKYYVKAGDYYYGGFSQSQVTTSSDGTVTLKKNQSSVSNLAYGTDGNKVYAPYSRTADTKSNYYASQNTIRKAFASYCQKNNVDPEAFVLEYYNDKDSTDYKTLGELYGSNADIINDLGLNNYTTVGIGSVSVSSAALYNNFYQNILSFNVGSKEDMESFLTDGNTSTDHGHDHGSWNSDGNELTIGDYMADKLDETEGAWDKANSYFNTLLASGMSEEEATWAAFTMAVNIDGELARNDYQNTAWSWYASIQLQQADGTLSLTKKDTTVDGEVIGDDADESETSFYIWKFEDNTETEEEGDTVPMYCTYVAPTYKTDEDGNATDEVETAGYYCWVKYDPEQDKMTYTVSTTNGKLNIDYAMLENVVYYLQEAVAPDGYELDTKVYVICDQESYDEVIEKNGGSSIYNPAAGIYGEAAYMGEIVGGETLEIEFVNTKTPVPDVPDVPDTEEPDEPEVPVIPDVPVIPPVQDATPDEPTVPVEETVVTPEEPELPAVQDATPEAAVATLPQTGTTSWLAGVLMSIGSLLTVGGWFATRKRHS